MLVAFPTFNDMLQGQRLKTQTNETLAAVIYAKSEALKRRSSVTVCAMKTNVDNQCGTSPTEWANGWIVFDDINGDGIVSNNDEILRYRGDYKKLDSQGTLTGLIFDGEGIADVSGDIEFCYGQANGNKMRRLSVNPAGNPIISSHAVCN